MLLIAVFLRKLFFEHYIINFYFVTCFYSLYDMCMVDMKTFLT